MGRGEKEVWGAMLNVARVISKGLEFDPGLRIEKRQRLIRGNRRGLRKGM